MLLNSVYTLWFWIFLYPKWLDVFVLQAAADFWNNKAQWLSTWNLEENNGEQASMQVSFIFSRLIALSLMTSPKFWLFSDPSPHLSCSYALNHNYVLVTKKTTKLQKGWCLTIFKFLKKNLDLKRVLFDLSPLNICQPCNPSYCLSVLLVTRCVSWTLGGLVAF